MVKGITEMFVGKGNFNDAQKARIENTGVLIAAGFIAGEALTGLAFAPIKIMEVKLFQFFNQAPIEISMVVLVAISYFLIRTPIKAAGSPDEPAPPSAMM